ncbi:MAG: TIGR03009 domain-containing protein [Planctomycetia bacterium]|nr:TIGR03009 domain-containing protein [Planctomycetia bacterium]
MSSRIVPLTALSVMLLVIFWAVVATAQQQQFPEQQQQPLPQQQLPPEQQQQQLLQQQQLPPQPLEQQLVGPPAGVPQQGLPPGNGMLPAPAPQPLQQAPFVLSPPEEEVLDRLLTDWQMKSGQVKTYESTFTRWDYDGVFGNANAAKRIVKGKLKYAAPDKGYYELDDASEKWICTGAAVFEFRNDLKQMREHPLPKAMQGQAIADGPMPFVFGVDAGKMKARYWLRITTPQANQADQVWLEVYPRHAKDAANFQKIDLILSFAHDGKAVTKLEPFALNMHLPNGKDRTVYQFTDMVVNGAFNNFREFTGVFVRPSTPFGWQHQVMPSGDEPEGAAPGANPQQAGPPNGQPNINVGLAPSANR